MKEIGGYLDCELSDGKGYYDFPAFNLTRSSLEFLIISENIKKIFIPYYLCDCIENVCLRQKIEIVYYHIDKQFKPILKDINSLSSNEYIFVVNYFGLISNSYIKILKEKYGNIIFDNTQSFFQKPVKNITTLYNCRKYFGVPDGGYLYIDKKIQNNYEPAKSNERINHIFGRFDNNASDYYKEYIRSEEEFDKIEIYSMSKLTKNLLGFINYNKVKKIRTMNYNYLFKYLKSNNKLKCKINCTYMYPLLINNGAKIREKLINKKVYVPKLWPGLDKYPLNDFEKYLFENLVVLPVDQRYSIEDMDYILDIINKG